MLAWNTSSLVTLSRKSSGDVGDVSQSSDYLFCHNRNLLSLFAIFVVFLEKFNGKLCIE